MAFGQHVHPSVALDKHPGHSMGRFWMLSRHFLEGKMEPFLQVDWGTWHKAQCVLVERGWLVSLWTLPQWAPGAPAQP